MKANTQPRFKTEPNIERELREHAVLINLMTDGRLAGTHNATTAAPASGSYAVGDFVRNSAPAEAGSAGSKYLVLGWVVTDDDPLAFLPCRVLTGN